LTRNWHVLEDVSVTLNGQGMDYREFEPSEGHMHQGLGRERRIRAGLRYSHGGRGKYWLPQSTASSRWECSPENGVYTPLLSEDEEDVIQEPSSNADGTFVAFGFDLPFGGHDSEDEKLFASSRNYLFGDYNYPCIDASSEAARAEMWGEEERILNNERSAWFSGRLGHREHHGRNALAVPSYGGVGVSQPQQNTLATTPSRSATIDTEPSLGPHSNAQLRWTNVFWPKIELKSPPNPGNSRVTSPISTEISAARHIARPDAVDLVTEDRYTADLSVSREHEPGERALGDVARQTDQSFGNLGREMVVEVRRRDKGDTPDAALRDAEGVDTNSEATTIIKTLGLAEPPQSQELVNVSDDLEGDENPWV